MAGDPLERHGAITMRPIIADQKDVLLLLHGRRTPTMPGAVRDLRAQLVRRATATSTRG